MILQVCLEVTCIVLPQCRRSARRQWQFGHNIAKLHDIRVGRQRTSEKKWEHASSCLAGESSDLTTERFHPGVGKEGEPSLMGYVYPALRGFMRIGQPVSDYECTSIEKS